QSGILTDDEFARVKETILGDWMQPSIAVFSQPFGPAAVSGSQYVGAQYAIHLLDLGGADPARLSRTIKKYLDVEFTPASLAVVPCIIVEGIGYATAESLRSSLEREGAQVVMVET
ncbi:MAG: hypothetical protein M3P18_09550, partial [Actinomycetota bacterium]|nr:hypothetical protein [Actinomycetota bacterium]